MDDDGETRSILTNTKYYKLFILTPLRHFMNASLRAATNSRARTEHPNVLRHAAAPLETPTKVEEVPIRRTEQSRS